MRETDIGGFYAVFDAVQGLYPNAKPATVAQREIWFGALAAHPLDAIRAAFNAHVKDPQRGRFLPMPADIIAQLEGAAADDGRPGPEEAWAIALTGADERATIVWTDEMAQAWGLAQPVLHGGDQVGARMAFREAYGRLVDAARRAGRYVTWCPSFGHDLIGRDEAIDRAVQRGMLARHDYPKLAAPGALMLDLARRPDVPLPSLREQLGSMRERIASAPRESALQWAFDLRDRELRGETLLPVQMTTWRAAIGATPLPAQNGPTFTPPPLETLPPAMYADRLAAANRSAA